MKIWAAWMCMALLACGRERAEVEVSMAFSLDGGTPEQVEVQDGVLRCGSLSTLEWNSNAGDIMVRVELPSATERNPPVEYTLTPTDPFTADPGNNAFVRVSWKARSTTGVGRITYVEERHGTGPLASSSYGVDFTDVTLPSHPLEMPAWSGRLTGKVRCVDRLPWEPAGDHEEWDPPSGGGGGGGD